MASNMDIDSTENNAQTSAAAPTPSDASTAVQPQASPAEQSTSGTNPQSPQNISAEDASGSVISDRSDYVSSASVMAPPDTVPSVSISLHPLVILNISEHWTRIRAEERTTDVEVLGALIGKQSGRNIEIMNSFELAFDKVCADVIINKKYYATKEKQYKQVFSDMDLLGWYRTGDIASRSDLDVHKQICELLDSPIFLKLNPLARHTDLPVSVFESVVDVVEGVPTLLFVELTYTLATEEAERIGIDHVARISSHDTAESSLVGENLQAQYNAIKMLASRVHIIAEFVRATQKGEVPFNHEIVRQINALAHRLPVFSNEQFKEEFFNQTNDVALMSYLGAITKCCNTMNRFINRFNHLHERYTVGRRMRGVFF